MDITNENIPNLNEYTFRWGKKFGYLTLKTYDTKLVIKQCSLEIDVQKFYLGFIKGKIDKQNISFDNNTQLEMKNIVHLSDLIVAGIYLFGGFFNPLFFLIAALAIWACFNTNIIVTNEKGNKITIPSYSKKDALEFIDFFNEVYKY